MLHISTPMLDPHPRMTSPAGHTGYYDALVIGAGPAGLAIAAALCQEGLQVIGLAPTDPEAPWANTYGIWADELDGAENSPLLSYCWRDCAVYAGADEIPLHRSYGLLDKDRLQAHWLGQCRAGQMTWHQGNAVQVQQRDAYSCVTTQAGVELSARLVIDASGHRPVFLQRPQAQRIAYQAAYGIVGRFSVPPIQHEMVLMDFRSEHLTVAERTQRPPTFLYGMDFGDGVYFVEETSLAHCPAVSFAELEQRLHRRLKAAGVEVVETHHIEHCLFPMNLPLPDLAQPILGFGGAASMVHPASGYLIGALLRRAPAIARSIAQSLAHSDTASSAIAQNAWQVLWSAERRRKHTLYLFGLENLMRFPEPQLHEFFSTFFRLPQPHWGGFLADTLSTTELVQAMLRLFGRTTNDVRRELITSAWTDKQLLWQALTR